MDAVSGPYMLPENPPQKSPYITHSPIPFAFPGMGVATGDGASEWAAILLLYTAQHSVAAFLRPEGSSDKESRIKGQSSGAAAGGDSIGLSGHLGLQGFRDNTVPVARLNWPFSGHFFAVDMSRSPETRR